mgnify:CR=1 FL=1
MKDTQIHKGASILKDKGIVDMMKAYRGIRPPKPPNIKARGIKPPAIPRAIAKRPSYKNLINAPKRHKLQYTPVT